MYVTLFYRTQIKGLGGEFELKVLVVNSRLWNLLINFKILEDKKSRYLNLTNKNRIHQCL